MSGRTVKSLASAATGGNNVENERQPSGLDLPASCPATGGQPTSVGFGTSYPGQYI